MQHNQYVCKTIFYNTIMVLTTSFEQEIKRYQQQQNAAYHLAEVVSDLWINQSVELVLFRNRLLHQRPNSLLQLFKKTSELTNMTLCFSKLLDVAKVIQGMELPPSRIDIGTLALDFSNQQNASDTIDVFIRKRLAPVIRHEAFEPRDVILYGFGRIGRLLARELINTTGDGQQLRLRAIVVRENVDPVSLSKRANLLKQDSIHGNFEGTVDIDIEKKALIINGITVFVLSAGAPEELDYTAYGIANALVIDNTGAFRDQQQLARHLKADGVSLVLLTAPGKGVPNIVYGINQQEVSSDTGSISSAASCTTNAISPVLAVIDQELGITTGHIETVHAYTNDQNLVDNIHKKYRRGRAAALNMVITETGAGKAVAKVLPSLAGKLTSNAVRVPIPNGSLAILHLEVATPCDVQRVQEILLNAALKGSLVEQIKYEYNPDLVSVDIIGTTAAAVIDAPAIIVSPNGKNVIIYVWYDNEYGYVHQVMRLARHQAGVRRYSYY